MISSEQLAAMTAKFTQQGGEIERVEIQVRDYSSPNGSFMMSSANDTPNIYKRSYSKAASESAIAVMQAKPGLSTEQVMIEASVSKSVVHAAARALDYKLARKKTGSKSSVTAAILAAANSLPNEQRTITRVAEIAKTSKTYASVIMKANGVTVTRSKRIYKRAQHD